MKKYVFFQLIFVIFAFFIIFNNFNSQVCFAANESIEEELGEAIEGELENIDFDEIDEFLVNSEFSAELFNGLSAKEIVLSILSGEMETDIISILNFCIRGVRDNLKKYLSAIMVILVVILICFLFNKVKSEMQKHSVEEIVYFVCFSIVITLIVKLSTGIIEDASNAIFSMQKQMNIVLPLLLTIMSGIGAVGLVAAFTPLVAFLSNMISNLFAFVLLPIFSLVFILSILNNLSNKSKFTNLISFFSSLFKWLVGICFTIFFVFFLFKE